MFRRLFRSPHRPEPAREANDNGSPPPPGPGESTGGERYAWPFRVGDDSVMEALATVPRAEFVPAPERASAHENRALPIEHGQTISQPYVVALMTDALGIAPGDRVLEVGTGSGYQTAVLAELGAEVFTIEVIADLAHRARRTLDRLGYTGIHYRIGDGSAGWPEAAPFDGVIVTCAATEIPPALWRQLKPGGRMVIPIGETPNSQELCLYERPQQRDGEGQSEEAEADEPILVRTLCPVRFVPLTHGEGEGGGERSAGWPG